MITQVGITGAAGRIGKLLTKGLSERYELTLFIRETKPDASLRLRTVRADLSKAEEVKGIFEGLDAVIHLAANGSIRAPWESALTTNIVATYNVLEEARRAGVIKFVFASTNHVQNGYVMGETPATSYTSYVKSKGLIKLTDPPAPDSLYGVSKLFGEDLGRYYARFFGIQFVALRIGGVAHKKAPPIRRGKADEAHGRAMFLSERDCVELVIRALEVDTEYLVAYGISNNKERIFDLTETRRKLGFHPKDKSEDFFPNNVRVKKEAKVKSEKGKGATP